MAKRVLYLVRHGQYHTARRDAGTLTQKGEEQAHMTALILRTLPFCRVYYSPMRRAAQTAEIIAAAFPAVLTTVDESLRECIPSIPARYVTYFAGHYPDLNASQLSNCLESMDTAFGRYFKPVEDDGDDVYELLVCHGNVIRFFVSKVLQVHVDTWANMLINNCGITRILIEADNQMYLVSHNDIGHLPEELRTEH
jgi:serine/threonine-protein phosphatase PGAM5